MKEFRCHASTFKSTFILILIWALYDTSSYYPKSISVIVSNQVLFQGYFRTSLKLLTCNQTKNDGVLLKNEIILRYLKFISFYKL